MLDDDERHPGVGRHRGEQLLERFEPARGRANADDRDCSYGDSAAGLRMCKCRANAITRAISASIHRHVRRSRNARVENAHCVRSRTLQNVRDQSARRVGWAMNRDAGPSARSAASAAAAGRCRRELLPQRAAVEGRAGGAEQDTTAPPSSCRRAEQRIAARARRASPRRCAGARHRRGSSRSPAPVARRTLSTIAFASRLRSAVSSVAVGLGVARAACRSRRAPRPGRTRTASRARAAPDRA